MQSFNLGQVSIGKSAHDDPGGARACSLAAAAEGPSRCVDDAIFGPENRSCDPPPECGVARRSKWHEPFRRTSAPCSWATAAVFRAPNGWPGKTAKNGQKQAIWWIHQFSCVFEVDALRGDTVLPDLLGIEKIVSAESMRRAVVDLAAQEAGQA